MPPIARILEDLKNGDNIDAYITVLVAIIAVGLNLFDKISQSTVLTLTLSVLALVGLYNIGNRYRMNNIIAIISNKSKILEKFPPEFATDIEQANELWLIGIHHSSFLNEHYSSLEKMLENGGILNAMLSDPDGNAIIMTSMRFPGNIKHEQEKARTIGNIGTFIKLHEQYPENVNIKIMDYLFEHSVAFVNPKAQTGKAYCQRYTFKTMGGARKPKLFYTPADGEWYSLIRSEIYEFWKCGIPISLDGAEDQ